VIGKVLRGANADGLLRYLYGPGRANEHIDPHLVAGFADPAELEPERRHSGSPDLRRLAGLLAQPLAALSGPGGDKPVWHCSVRAAPGDRVLSDGEWAQVAAEIMHRTGLAPHGDDLGVRWVAVRHAGDHIHIVATLARQDGTKPRTWNDFYRVREACQDAERRFGLRPTAPADRTAARRATRAARRSGSLSRNGTRSTSTPPARPHGPRSTSAIAPTATRPQRPTPRGRRLTRCMPRRGRCAARSCGARPTPTTGPPAPVTAGSRAAAETGTACAPRRGCWLWLVT